MGKKNDKLTKIFEQNENLVKEYNKIPRNLPLFEVIDDVKQQLSLLPKSNTLGLPELIRKALKYCIESECDIIDGINHVMNQSFECNNLIQMYFKEVGKIYEANDDNYDIEYCPENRKKLINMNLKTAIAIAKRYQGCGVPLEDLISASNLGLCKAFDKFRPESNDLQQKVLEEIENLNTLSGREIFAVITKHISYGGALDRLQKRFKDDVVYERDAVEKWVKNNIKSAKFSSVAVMWMRQSIFNEIEQNSRLVAKKKNDLKKDKEKYGGFVKENIVDIDELPEEGDLKENDSIEVQDSYNYYKENVREILKVLSPRERNIVLRRFGIGIPRPSSPKEIALYENLTVARVSQIFQNAMIKLREHAMKSGIDPSSLFEACQSFR